MQCHFPGTGRHLPSAQGKAVLELEGDFHLPTVTEVLPQGLLQKLMNVALRPGVRSGSANGPVLCSVLSSPSE